MAVAPEVLEEGAAAERGGQAAAAAGGARSAGRSGGGGSSDPIGAVNRAVGTPSAAAQTVAKLLWAVALGLIVLEIAAQATGQQWGLHLGQGATGAKPQKGAYLPLVAGQQPIPAMPGMFSGPVTVQGPDTNLSGRAGGNQAVG